MDPHIAALCALHHITFITAHTTLHALPVALQARIKRKITRAPSRRTGLPRRRRP